ncbi:uncharacterized protein TNIN_249921 [Trichonephila inaurata madagascariensis]|uniref:Uncharacterized protein n=1 Tax=Trichonephila inaurata madagascariensis TaxID=2747483 RepID=A0A8X6XQJ7_9ARAC|nr:uncharacterized protein TNIN_249921 [Trichonephila inaurata madagascariensis]
MPKNYIKKTSGSRYTKEDLKKAVLEVKNGSTIYAASKKNLVFLKKLLEDGRDVINLVETNLATNKTAQLLFPNTKPGIEWIRGFEKRWKEELSKKKPE